MIACTHDSDIPKVLQPCDMNALHNNPVSQVTQAAQVLKFTISFNFERLMHGPYQGMTQCVAKFGNELAGTGRSLDKKECKMSAATDLLTKVNDKYGDWKNQQQANKKAKKRQYKTEYRKRQEDQKRSQIMEQEERERQERRERRVNEKVWKDEEDADRCRSTRSRSRSPQRRQNSGDNRNYNGSSSTRYSSSSNRIKIESSSYRRRSRTPPRYRR